MHYIKRRKERRKMQEYVPRKRGFTMTMIGLVAAGAFVALTKANNPEMDIKPMMMMVGGVALGCVVMNFISSRKK